MSLATPDSVRTLQRKLYLKAKAEPDYQFYLLYDKIYRADVLRHAYQPVDKIRCHAQRRKMLSRKAPGRHSMLCRP